MEGGDLLTYIWPMTMYTLLLAMLLCASATPLNLPHSAPNGSHAGPVCWGYLDRGGIAASKADSVRRGALQKPTNPILVRDHNPNNFHMVFKQEGAVIYGWLWAVASVRVCVCRCVTEGERCLLLMFICKCHSSSGFLLGVAEWSTSADGLLATWCHE